MTSIQVIGEDSRASNTWLHAADFQDRPVLLLQPGRKGPLRGARRAAGDTWPLSRWGRLCALVRHELAHVEPLLIGAPGEIALLAAVQRASRHRVRMLASELNAKQLDFLQEQAVGMIALDTGTARAIAALGCPTVVLCDHGASLRPPAHAADPLAALRADHQRGITGFGVDEVLHAWRELMAQGMRHSKLFRR